MSESSAFFCAIIFFETLTHSYKIFKLQIIKLILKSIVYLVVILGLPGSFNEDFQIVDDFFDPTLFVTLLQGLTTHLGHDSDAAANHGSLKNNIC